MANPRLIKKRVNSIKNIGKITKALEMVSASRVQKAQEKAIRAKPYANMINELVRRLAEKNASIDIPLMRQPEEIKSDLFILISTNRGLAGSLNTNLFREISQFLEKKNSKHNFVTVGKKGRVFAMQKGQFVADFSESKDLGGKVTDIVKLAIKGFVTEVYDEVYIVYSDFLTALLQEPIVKRILPIKAEELSEGYETGDLLGRREKIMGSETTKESNCFYEPDPVTVLTDLLPYYIEIQIAESFYEAEASEHSARMIAMKNASDNASELTEGLSLEYNKARQSMITTEMSDIATAQESLK